MSLDISFKEFCHKVKESEESRKDFFFFFRIGKNNIFVDGSERSSKGGKFKRPNPSHHEGYEIW